MSTWKWCTRTPNSWATNTALLHTHSPRFALRSYTYLLPHAAVLLPQHLLLESAAAKRAQFHTLRAILGLACAFAEASMCRAVARTGGMRLAYLTWAILVSSSGMFTASTTFLPSTFAMVTFCIGASFSLEGRHKVIRGAPVECCMLISTDECILNCTGRGGDVRRGRVAWLAICRTCCSAHRPACSRAYWLFACLDSCDCSRMLACNCVIRRRFANVWPSHGAYPFRFQVHFRVCNQFP